MTKAQIILLPCTAILYIATIVNLINYESGLALLFLILHSLGLLYFCFLCYKNSKSTAAEEKLSAMMIQCQELTANNSAIADKLSQTMEELEALTRIHQELEEAHAKLLEDTESAPKEERKEIPKTAVIAAAEASETTKTSEISETSEAAETTEAPEGNKNTENKPEPAVNFASFLPPTDSHEAAAQTINIIQIAKDTVEEFTSFSESAGINVLVSSASDTLLVKADSNRIRVLFRNIIDNSIKYMKQAGTLVITLSTVGDDIFIVLKDNGKGLPEDETPHIFEINYQGSNRISGNGLGLTQAKAIVESYGGTIYAKSTSGKGMGIYIQIPID